MPNKLSQIWQELKRRNVVRVITVYAGAAFVILELVDMVTEPFGLPAWTFKLAIVILSIGFLVAIILSWIYDIHPEGGVIKTESAQSSSVGKTPGSSNSWKIASYISFVVIVGLILLNIIPRGGKREMLEKSVAVLPFINESSDQVNSYFINGMMESILNNLSSIEDLRVVSRNTVERYRNTPKSTPAIAEELDVSYVLEGSGQKVGNRLLLTVQLIIGTEDNHIWSKQYDRTIEKVEDLIDIQKEIAYLIVDEIEALITPEEQNYIEEVPTVNLEAYDFYLRGLDYMSFSQDEEHLQYAMQMFEKAIELDSNLVSAWLGLASSCRFLNHFGYDLSEENNANAKTFIDKAKALAPDLKDVQLQEAAYYYQCNLDYAKSLQILQQLNIDYPNDAGILGWTGMVYKRMGEFTTSLEYSERAITLNPYMFAWWLYTAETYRVLREYANTEKYLKKANELDPMNPDPYLRLVNLYMLTGQLEKAKTYLTDNNEHFDIHEQIQHQAQLEFLERNFEAAVQSIQSLTNETIIEYEYYLSKHVQLGFLYYPKDLQLGLVYHAMGDNDLATSHFSKAKDYFESIIEDSENDSRVYSYLGLSYAGIGMKEEAVEAGGEALDILSFENDAHGGFGNELNMVKILVLVNEYDEALSHLNRIISNHGNLTVEILKTDPFWDPVRSHEKFLEIINNQIYLVNM